LSVWSGLSGVDCHGLSLGADWLRHEFVWSGLDQIRLV
jgi:hypothetical protein